MSKHCPNYAGFYAIILPRLQEVARSHGYAIAIHGSMIRDMDILATPWIEGASPTKVFLQAMCEEAGGFVPTVSPDDPCKIGECILSDGEAKPHGRVAYTIAWPGRAFIDLSIVGGRID